MASPWMKRVRFTSYLVGDGWGYVVHVDKKEAKREEGFPTEKEANAAGYKEKQRLVMKLQQGKYVANCLLEFAVLLVIAGLIIFLFFNGFGIGG